MIRAHADLLIEGYASLFGVADLAGDVVRAGAFAASLRRWGGDQPPMLLAHAPGRVAGVWTTLREDGRGLFVRGLVQGRTAAGVSAADQIRRGVLGGLSIGFLARDWKPRAPRGRELREIDLREVSLVASPMLPDARFEWAGELSRAA